MSQSDVAERMGTSQPAVARLESGHKPSLKTLERYAEAVGMKVEIITPRRWLTSECRGRESIYRWVDSKSFPARRVGRLLRFRLSEVDEWVKNDGESDSETHSPSKTA